MSAASSSLELHCARKASVEARKEEPALLELISGYVRSILSSTPIIASSPPPYDKYRHLALFWSPEKGYSSRISELFCRAKRRPDDRLQLAEFSFPRELIGWMIRSVVESEGSSSKVSIFVKENPKEAALLHLFAEEIGFTSDLPRPGEEFFRGLMQAHLRFLKEDPLHNWSRTSSPL